MAEHRPTIEGKECGMGYARRGGGIAQQQRWRLGSMSSPCRRTLTTGILRNRVHETTRSAVEVGSLIPENEYTMTLESDINPKSMKPYYRNTYVSRSENVARCAGK